MASEENLAPLKSVLVNSNSSEQEVKQAYLQLALQYTSNKSSKSDERSHAARLRDITSIFLKRVPAEKYKGQSDEEILFHVFKDAFSFTFKDNCQSRVLESSSSQSCEERATVNGGPPANEVTDSSLGQGLPNIFDILKDKSATIASKRDCIQNHVGDKAESRVNRSSEETQGSGSGQEKYQDQAEFESSRTSVSLSPSGGGIQHKVAPQNGISSLRPDCINEIACKEQKAKDIDQAKVSGENRGSLTQYNGQGLEGLQVKPTNQQSDSSVNNSTAIIMSQWPRDDGQKGPWSNGPAVTSGGWTSMDTSNGQPSMSHENSKSNTSPAAGVMSSIWGSGSGPTPTSGWGSLPSASSTSTSSSFQPSLFQNSNGHSGGSVWGNPPTPQPSGSSKESLSYGGANPVSMPSTTSSSNPSSSQNSGWDSSSANQNGMETQQAPMPTSTASNLAVPTTSQSSSNGGSTPMTSNGQDSQQQVTPVTTASQGMPPVTQGDMEKDKVAAGNGAGQRPNGQGWGMPGPAAPNGFNPSTGTSSWGNPPAPKDGGTGWQKQGSSWGGNNQPGPATLTGTGAWGAPHSGTSSGWGAEPSDQTTSSAAPGNKPWGGGNGGAPTGARGWGNPGNMPGELSGTSSWGKPAGNDAGPGWGDRPPTTPTSGPPSGGPSGPPSGWNGSKDNGPPTPTTPGWGNRPSGWGNQPPQQGQPGPRKEQPENRPTGWGKPSGGSSWAQTASKGVERSDDSRNMNPGQPSAVDQASIAALVKTPWGKRPVNQEFKWDSRAAQSTNTTQAGTSGWSNQPPQDRQWEKAEQPKQSAWGRPNPPPTPTETSWGNTPPTTATPPVSSTPSGWGTSKERTDGQDSGWGQPPPTSSAPPGSAGPRGPPVQPAPPPAQSAPPATPPTPGFSTERSSPPQKDPMESSSSTSSNTPQPPTEESSQSLPLPPPKKIVATGWGDIAVMERSPMQVDNGTGHWGDPNEHNRRLTRRQAGGHLPQMGGNPQNSTMQGPPSTGPQGDTSMPMSNMMPHAPPSQFKPDNQWEDKSKPSSWGDFPNNRASSSGSGSMWNSGAPGGNGGGNKWDQSSTPSWGPSSSTNVSTQNKDSMQQNWQDDNSTGTIGHWGDEEWETRSQNSESSITSGWRTGPKKSRPPGQRESNHYISKLKRLMDYGFPKEMAEVGLRKHNFHFESALAELRQISDMMMDQNKMPQGDMDDPVRQMSRTMNNLVIGDNTFSDPNKMLSSGTDLANANMLLNNSLTSNLANKPGSMMSTPGYMPASSSQRFNSVSQQPNLLMGQQPGNLGQPVRGPFNSQQQQMMQQQQQLFQVLLQLAVQSGIVNQNLLQQQQVTPQQIMNIAQRYPQLLAQAQAQQGLPPGGTHSAGKGIGSGVPNRSQQELMARFVQQQILQGQRPPVSRPFPSRPKVCSDSEMYTTSQSSDLLGNIGGMNPDIGGMREPPQQSRLQQFFGKPGSKNFPRQNRSESVAGLSDSSRRSTWSRSNSPTPSDSLPNSADSTFSDSGWNFPQRDTNISSAAIGDDVPEFIPGVPWIPSNLDVSNDPSATPGMFASAKAPGRDQPNKDNDISGILTRPMKPQSSWSNPPAGGRKSSWNYPEGGNSGFPGASRSNQLWNSAPGNQQRSTRPPPGLGEQPHSSSWRGIFEVAPSGKNPQMQGHAVLHRSSWSSGNGMSGSNTIVISGLGPDLQGALQTVKSICNQSGQVELFQEQRNQGSITVSYRFAEEAAKAQSTLVANLPGIDVEFASTGGDAATFPTPTATSATPSSGWSQGGGKFNGVLPTTTSSASIGKEDSSKQSWNAGLPAMPGSQLWSPGPSGSMGWSPMAGDSNSASSFSSFLPENLLRESSN
ncbi:uncharacterized protein [Diadema antillarum]|uniref:uncharacterized protein isoform X1 n=1 Tax=Diadema antillarum TaxID=105358 RepID=UPI003A87BADE